MINNDCIVLYISGFFCVFYKICILKKFLAIFELLDFFLNIFHGVRKKEKEKVEKEGKLGRRERMV